MTENIYYIKNKDKIIERSKQYILDNPEKHKKYQDKWLSNNRDRRILYMKKYRLQNKKRSVLHKDKYKNRDSGLPNILIGMRSRCTNPNQISYKYYGGKGITVEWKTYKDFKKDMYDSYIKHVKVHGKANTTIDRIDSRKNYCKENCRWTNYEGQGESKRNQKILEQVCHV